MPVRDLATFEETVVRFRSQHAAEHGMQHTLPLFGESVFASGRLNDYTTLAAALVSRTVEHKPLTNFPKRGDSDAWLNDRDLADESWDLEAGMTGIKKENLREFPLPELRLNDHTILDNPRVKHGLTKGLGEVHPGEEPALLSDELTLRIIAGAFQRRRTQGSEQRAAKHVGEEWPTYLALALAEAAKAGKDIILEDASIQAVNVVRKPQDGTLSSVLGELKG